MATLHQLFEAAADRTPRAVALVDGSREVTYAELEAQANRIARRLRRLGAGPETPVGICTERNAGMVAALLGTLKAGAAYLALGGVQCIAVGGIQVRMLCPRLGRAPIL